MFGKTYRRHDSIVSVQDLKIQYGSNTAVNGISFEIFPGEAVGILGENGAGKSSTMKTLATIAPPSDGSVVIDGHSMTDLRKIDNAKMLLGYCPDVGGLIRSATPREHIGLLLELHGKTEKWQQAVDLLDAFNLLHVIDQPTSGFSHGMSRRLSVILAAIASEKLLILDEPFDGVDPFGVETTIELINQAKKAGLGVVLSTHLQDILVEASDRVIVMEKGKIVAENRSRYFAGKRGKRRYRNLLVRHADDA